jgi:hypothetical protein
MRTRRPPRICLALAVLSSLARPLPGSAQTVAAPAGTAHRDSTMQRDGQHDFDFMIGTWKVYLKRLMHPLTTDTAWVEYTGKSVVRPIWGGRANLDEFAVDNPTTHAHIEGLTLRLYDPGSRRWSLYWANARNGTLALPATVGGFTDGRGEFYDQEDFQGRPILVRYLWFDITATSARFEQAFSADSGKTWQPNWISTITRVKE